MNLFDKARTITLGNLHDLLDKVVDMNSPAAVRQNVRDLETALNEMGNNVAIQAGQLRTSNREFTDLASKIETTKATVTQLLKSTDPTAPALARERAQIIVTEQKQLDELSKSLVDQKNTIASMTQALTQLQAKHDLLVVRAHELERLDRDTKAKEHAATAIQNAGSVLNSSSSQSIDNLEANMQRRNDVASAKFDQSMGSFNSQPESNSDDVDALLASLR